VDELEGKIDIGRNMGQYQQWLHYREVDQQLHTRIQQLGQELLHLEEELNCLEEVVPQDNAILQALKSHFNASNPAMTNGHTEFSSSSTLTEPSAVPVSPALSAWGGLPNLSLQEEQERPLNPQDPPPPLSTPHPELALLPEDMAAFFDQHELTEPQIELPWWLSNIAIASTNGQDAKPIDQQSGRSNRLVQRWIQRWGQQPSSVQKPQEGMP
jgi:hypothetical protein